MSLQRGRPTQIGRFGKSSRKEDKVSIRLRSADFDRSAAQRYVQPERIPE